MTFNQTPVSERVHIGFFGSRNAGKSLLVNKVTNQEVSVVSDTKGTTTDPVKKTMELLPLGPVVIIDTPGVDDEGTLGKLRVEKTNQILLKTDIAVLVIDSLLGFSKSDKELEDIFKEKNIPYIVVYNKVDLINKRDNDKFYVSAKTLENINELKEKLASLKPNNQEKRFIIADKLEKGDKVILVIPIDESAPAGRIILPQQSTLRELLDNHIKVLCVQPEELQDSIKIFSPKLVITDSQVFNKVKEIVPQNIFLTSFSILFARYKGNLEKLTRGAKLLKSLKTGDKVLISEGCTHHRQCNDIGTKKLPMWIENFSGAKPNFEFTSGGEYPMDTSKYKLVVHCGGCMLNPKEMASRLERTENIVNYGVAISCMNGILDRALEILK
ncbi:MAG: [FeFe] hydrogenase H-cluster maturation GTPase HydF [Bdellovibrionota bacterium]|nr:[FeFe] hydrogenase H-cluster maturation GTPase HydF [Pseudomonadota bacterium]MDY6090699.1 [FeFe] hydrogenase H-cluster maturation GTPase HydF [Bdellovibrionota bacterium]